MAWQLIKREVKEVSCEPFMPAALFLGLRRRSLSHDAPVAFLLVCRGFALVANPARNGQRIIL